MFSCWLQAWECLSAQHVITTMENRQGISTRAEEKWDAESTQALLDIISTWGPPRQHLSTITRFPPWERQAVAAFPFSAHPVDDEHRAESSQQGGIFSRGSDLG